MWTAQTTWGICSEDAHALPRPDPIIVVSPSKWAFFCVCSVWTASLPFLLLWQRTGLSYVKPGTHLRRGKSRCDEAVTVHAQCKLNYIFASRAETNCALVHMRDVCMMRAYYRLECLPRLFTLQMRSNTCPHSACTERCLALMNRQLMDQATHHAEADRFMPCNLHALFPALLWIKFYSVVHIFSYIHAPCAHSRSNI